MIVPEVAERPERAEGDAGLSGVWQAFLAAEARFAWDPAREGLDLACLEALAPLADGGEERPNRARAKAWRPTPRQLVVWFYKDSQIPFSTDRFSYGAAIWKADPELEAFDPYLTWMVSGLDPRLRPTAVRRAFPFTLPT